MGTQALKEELINDIIIVEGGYVDDPSDSGGETNWGITVKVARQFGYDGPMKDFPRETAFSIYESMYWDSVKGDDLARLSHPVAREIVDTAVNLGVGRASGFLQRSLNIMNNRGQLYDEVIVDNSIGPKTLISLSAYLALRSEKVLCKALNCLQGSFYIELAEKREKDERFIYGWLKNRVGL